MSLCLSLPALCLPNWEKAGKVSGQKMPPVLYFIVRTPSKIREILTGGMCMKKIGSPVPGPGRWSSA